jgi:hypothetical protein
METSQLIMYAVQSDGKNYSGYTLHFSFFVGKLIDPNEYKWYFSGVYDNVVSYSIK